jgi:hypothetical protein
MGRTAPEAPGNDGDEVVEVEPLQDAMHRAELLGHDADIQIGRRTDDLAAAL